MKGMPRMTEKSMEEVLREIRDTCGMEILGNGRRLVAAFCDFSQVKKDQRLMRYFVETGGNTALLAAKKLSPAMQQARLGQVVNKMCSETLVSEDVALMVCTGFWNVACGKPISITCSMTATNSQGSTSTIDHSLNTTVAVLAKSDIPYQKDIRKSASANRGEFLIHGTTLVKYLGKRAEVTVPEQITGIADEAFAGNLFVQKVVMLPNITDIGDRIFENCENLETVIFSDNVYKIGSIASHTFRGCRKLKNVHLPNALYHFDVNMFQDCDSLQRLSVPGTIQIVGTWEIRRNEKFARNLVHLTLGVGCREISYFAFSGCSKLRTLEIPDTVTKLAKEAFWGCSKNVQIIASEHWKAQHRVGPEYWKQDPFVIGSGPLRATLLQYMGCEKSVRIPGDIGITGIGKGAFQYNEAIEEVEIGKGICGIREYAFADCRNLRKVMLPATLQRIKKGAFSGCIALREINIPDTLKTLEDGVFDGCTSLERITIPDNLEGEYTFPHWVDVRIVKRSWKSKLFG